MQLNRLSRLALFLALATMIHTAESMLPVTFLWLRFGFANIITLATLYLYGFRDAAFITIGRAVLGSLWTGLLGSPAFMLSLSGGIAAIVVMEITRRLGGKYVSEIGVSVLGAVAHNLAQLFAAYVILVRNEGILLFMPIMLLAATGTGFINGIAARYLVDYFRKAPGFARP
jgi:heptaprenyl diphosphate synthase